MGRVGSLAHTLPAPGAANSTSWSFGYNAASQIVSTTRSNDAYAFTGSVNVDRAYSANGLNQYTVAGPASFCYDANGNLTADGSSVFLYDPENRLVEKHVTAVLRILLPEAGIRHGCRAIGGGIA